MWQSRTLAERLFWGTIIAVCLLFSVLTTEWMFDEYLDHQTATLFTFEQRQRNEGYNGKRDKGSRKEKYTCLTPSLNP
jgi:hypothetical protein